MISIMEKLGIELPLLITQIINFLIVLFVLNKFLYKPILKVLLERKKKIAEGLAWAQKAEAEEEKLTQRKQEIVKEAREEARVILENAKKGGQKLKEEFLLEGKKELAQLKAKLQGDADGKVEDLSRELTTSTIDIAAAMVKQILPKIMTREDQHKLIMNRLRELEKVHEKKS